MPTRFYPKKMIAKIRKRKHLNAIHKEKLEKLIKETDNFDNYREEHRRQLTQLNATTLSLDNYHKNKKLKKGGSVPRGRKPKKVVDENKAMVLSQNKAIAHHTDELKTAINKSDKKVEAWVVGKVERASTDISDVTHYLEGQTEYAEGGKIAERYFVVETFPNGRKRKLMDYPDYDTAEVYARMKTNFRSKGNVITIENSQSEVMKEFKKGGKMGMGGQVGDNALVLSANKMGYITEVGNGTYTLRFPEGTQSVFKASELQIMNDDEYFGNGGEVLKTFRHKHIPTMTYDVIDYTSNGYKGIQKDSKSLSSKERKEGKMVYYSKAEIKELFDEKFAKGGDTSKYNYGRSWHMDKRKFNKSESYELAMNTRKKAMGGEVGTWKSNALGDGALELSNSNVFIRDNGGDYGRGRYDIYQRGQYNPRISFTPIYLIASMDDLDEAKMYGYNNRYAKGGYMPKDGRRFIVMQDTNDWIELGFWGVIDVWQQRLVDIFEFQVEADAFAKEMNEKGTANPKDFNGQFYKYIGRKKADGGMMADGGSVNNGNFEVVSIMLAIYDQQGDEQLYEYLEQDQGLNIVSQDVKDYRKEKGVANEYFSENGKYYFVVFKKADLTDIIGFEKMMDGFFVPMGMRYTYSEQTKMSKGGFMADGGEMENRRTLKFSDAVLYKDEMYEFVKKDGELGFVSHSQGAWGMNGRFLPLGTMYRSDLEENLTDMYGNKFYIPNYEDLMEMPYGFAKGGFMADGGEVEGVDLFEDYEDQPKEVEAIISKYEIEDYNYDVLQKMREELESIGYTMDFGLDAEPYDLRKIGQRGKSEFYAKGGMMEYVGMTDGGRYNIVDEGKVVETNVSHKGVIDYANTTAFYDIMDESDMGDIHEISNFDDAVKYLGMVGVEVVSIGADGMSVPNKTQYFIENMGSLKDDIDFILEMNDVNYSAKGEDYILLTTPDKIKFIVSDIEDIDDPKAQDIVVRTINNVLHGTYVEPTKKRFTEGMSEKTAEKILKKLGVVGNAPQNETQKARSQANNGLVLFTPEIDKKLFEQYKLGSELENQDVVVKIFNPYGQGTWYIMNADPEEPDYMWGIVDLFETEMGSISRDELVSLRISPLKFKLERDTSFKPTNAKVIFDGLMDGKHFKLGGNVTYNFQTYTDNEIQ